MSALTLCIHCGQAHAGDDVAIVGDPREPKGGYRATGALGAPVRATRAEAEKDACVARRGGAR